MLFILQNKYIKNSSVVKQQNGIFVSDITRHLGGKSLLQIQLVGIEAISNTACVRDVT